MRIFKLPYFSRWARKSGISDAALVQAVAEMEAGIIDSELGGNLLKKRIPIPGRG